MIMKLCLISCEPTKLKDKTSGEESIRYKYLFLSEKETVMIGWADERLSWVDKELVDSNTYQEARARAYAVKLDSFNGKLTYKVALDSDQVLDATGATNTHDR